MNDQIEMQIQTLKEMAKKEKDAETRAAIYEALASCGSQAINALIDLAQSEEDADVKKFAISKITMANQKK